MEDKYWRFLNTGLKNAYMNMAIDEVISNISVPRDQKSVLRVYGWKPYAISLGYNQDENDIDLERCDRDNIDVVRRPTGGRAVFHADEVTYSVVIPESSNLFYEDTLTIYNTISEGLVEGLRLIGIAAQLMKRTSINSAIDKSNVPCFSSVAKYEITYRNKKLVGSAQRRFQNAILQHGSILVGIQHLKLGEYISKQRDINIESFTKYLFQKTISVSQIISTRLKYDQIIWGIKNGFQKRFNIQFFEGQLTSKEVNEAQKLIKKYEKIRRKKNVEETV